MIGQVGTVFGMTIYQASVEEMRFLLAYVGRQDLDPETAIVFVPGRDSWATGTDAWRRLLELARTTA